MTVPGEAAAWRRDALLPRSPAPIPWPDAPTRTAAGPVPIAARKASGGKPSPDPNAVTPSIRSSAARTARSASSSWDAGVPQTATTASPINLSTEPPYRAMTLRAVSKYRVRTSRTSSGSRLSDRVVKPTRSAKSTDTTRRSVAGMTVSPTPPVSGPSARAAPQSPQNFSPGWFAPPQAGHATASGAAHWAQNLRPGRFSAPQREQTNTATLRKDWAERTITHIHGGGGPNVHADDAIHLVRGHRLVQDPGAHGGPGAESLHQHAGV